MKGLFLDILYSLARLRGLPHEQALEKVAEIIREKLGSNINIQRLEVELLSVEDPNPRADLFEAALEALRPHLPDMYLQDVVPLHLRFPFLRALGEHAGERGWVLGLDTGVKGVKFVKKSLRAEIDIRELEKGSKKERMLAKALKAFHGVEENTGASWGWNQGGYPIEVLKTGENYDVREVLERLVEMLKDDRGIVRVEVPGRARDRLIEALEEAGVSFGWNRDPNTSEEYLIFPTSPEIRSKILTKLENYLSSSDQTDTEGSEEEYRRR